MQDSFDACVVACKFEHDVASATRRVGSWLELVGELWTDVYSESRAFFCRQQALLVCAWMVAHYLVIFGGRALRQTFRARRY